MDTDIKWILLWSAVAAASSAGVTYDAVTHHYRTSAIEAGVGKWTVDRYGKTEFQ
jgi:hypothetical protein